MAVIIRGKTAVPKQQRGVTYGAFTLMTAQAGLIGNDVCGIWLSQFGAEVFAACAGAAIVGACLLWLPGIKPLEHGHRERHFLHR